MVPLPQSLAPTVCLSSPYGLVALAEEKGERQSNGGLFIFSVSVEFPFFFLERELEAFSVPWCLFWVGSGRHGKLTECDSLNSGLLSHFSLLPLRIPQSSAPCTLPRLSSWAESVTAAPTAGGPEVCSQCVFLFFIFMLDFLLRVTRCLQTLMFSQRLLFVQTKNLCANTSSQ